MPVRILQTCFLVFFLALAGALPLVAHADSIGISPPTIIRELYQGMQVSTYVTVSRQGTDGYSVFSLMLSGDPIIDLDGQTSLVIPEGEQSVQLPLRLLGDGLPVGEYDARLQILLQNGEAAEENASNLIQYALIEQIHLTILPSASAGTTLSLQDYPDRLADLIVADLSITKSVTDHGHILHLRWKLENQGDYALQGAVADVVLTQHGASFREEFVAASEIVMPGGSIDQTLDLPISYLERGGVYNIEVSVGENDAQASAWIVQPLFKKQMTIILAGLMAALVVAASLLIHDRHLKTGNHRP